jgi:6-phosphogluconolactonase
MNASALATAAIVMMLLGPVPIETSSQVVAPPANHLLYTMTNASAGNEILIYSRQPGSGALTFVTEVPTGGNGTGGGLGNQGGLILTEDRNFVLVVNAGSNTLSSLRVTSDGLTLVDTESTGGTMPISVTECDGIVYVLNAGGTGGIRGFTLSNTGALTPIPGSIKPLSGAAAPAPAQIGFSPDCQWLVVTEKETDVIDVYSVNANGVAGDPVENESAGGTPFGFSFDSAGRLIVSEAFDGAAGESAVSSYQINANGTLTAISESVSTTETAACWVVLARNGKYAFTTNTGSGTITGYSVGNQTGALTLLDTDGVTANLGAGTMPIDLAVSRNGRHLYVLLGGTDEIKVFEINADGSLTPLEGGASNLLPNANGLVAA